MPPLSEQQVRINDEKMRRQQVIKQKQVLKQMQRDQAKSIKSNLHKKTHYKALTSLVMEDSKCISLEDGSAH